MISASLSLVNRPEIIPVPGSIDKPVAAVRSDPPSPAVAAKVIASPLGSVKPAPASKGAISSLASVDKTLVPKGEEDKVGAAFAMIEKVSDAQPPS